MDYIQFTGPIKPLGASTFAVLEDKYVQGGFRVVANQTELQSLDPTVLKLGMYVSVAEESGKLYHCDSISAGFNEFGDPVATYTFSAVKLSDLPTATGQTLGGIKVGLGLTVDADGTLHAPIDVTAATSGQSPMVNATGKVVWRTFEAMADSATYNYDSEGKLLSIVEIIADETKTIIYSYNADGTVATITYKYLGIQRVETYTYNNGLVSTMSAIITQI